MRKLRDILRLRLDAGLSYRQISASTKVSVGTIGTLINKANELTLSWPLAVDMDDQQLAQLFYPNADTAYAPRCEVPDWTTVHQELKRKGVTRQLLWEEYAQQYPNRCYSYSQFCERYQHWFKKQRRSMRQVHKAGDKLFIDYAGQTVSIIDGHSGEIREAQIFIAVLGASNYTYCEATWTQTLPDWLSAHARAFDFIGGVPKLLVPDNLKGGVNKACRYDPDINLSYQQMAAHYGTAIMPARPRTPKDKAKVEVGVQIIERWILARLRHYTFFSLAELNQCIRGLLDEVNTKPFKQLKGTRQQWFESIDKPALSPLPKQAYEYTEIKTVKVNIDYHVQFDQHLYSVPHHLVGERLELHAKAHLIELYFKHRRICSHARKYRPGTTTVTEHMPLRHAKHHQWSAGRLLNWAKDMGDEVLIWVKVQHRLKQIKSILKSNQDQLVTDENEPLTLLPQTHENIRGPQSFH